MPLPPGLTDADFAKVSAQLRGVVGDKWVITQSDALTAYADPYAPGIQSAFLASGAVLPANVDEIRGVLAVASRYSVPLWTISQGRNFAYGGAAPRVAGSLILDLKRLNAIEVDEELAYAIVEPGVSYLDLYRHLQKNKSKLWIDCTDPGWGSVVGNALEYGIGYTPYGDHAGQVCGLEVMLANGELVRTGMGAMPDNPAWPLYRHAFGPSLDGLFFQSNLGIVTKMGIWLMPSPDVYTIVEITFQHETDIAAIIDTLRPLRLGGTIANATIANWMRIAAGATTRAKWYGGKGPMPAAAVAKLKQSLEIGAWGLRFGLYGEARIVEEKLKIVQAAFSPIEGRQIDFRRFRRGDKISPELQTAAGIPGVDLMPLDWLGGAGAHIECPLVVPMRGADFYALYQRRTAMFNAHGFDHYCGLTSTTPRSFINTGSIIFDSNDDEQAAQARALGAALIEDARAHHLGGYRAHISEMDLVAAQYDFNDHALLRLNERLKDALDPAGILSPGKQGIWPKRLRKDKDGTR